MIFFCFIKYLLLKEMSELKNNLRTKLLENTNKIIAYHGSNSNITSFTDDFVGGRDALDEQGPGIYFSTSMKNANSYGKNVYKVELTPINPVSVEVGKNAPIKQIEWLIKQADDWKSKAQNFHINPNSGLKIAANDFIKYNETPHEQFLQVWYDFYLYEPVNYVRNMVKLGYDSIIINNLNSISDVGVKVTHIIVLDPSIIKYLGQEDSNNKEELVQEERIINEVLMRIDDDVNMIYEKYFEYDIDALVNKGVKIDSGYFIDSQIDTSILKNPLCVKAHELNPCTILINSKSKAINIYSPTEQLISIGVQKFPLHFIIREGNGYFHEALKILKYYGEGDDQKLMMDFTEERIKGSIHHELVHWLDDTLHNKHINNYLNKAQKKPNKKRGNLNGQSIEIQAQIHNILQLKNKYPNDWDNLTFMEMLNLSVPLKVIYRTLQGDERTQWIKKLKNRMYREDLLGKKMV